MDFIEDKYITVFKLNKEINNFINKELNGILQKLVDLENYIKKTKDLINDVKKEVEELKNKSINTNDIKLIKDILEINKNKANEIKLNILPLLSKSEEKLMSIIFKSFDENINYSVICKNTDEFEKIESLLYDKYPEYKELKNNFILNGKEIDKSKSLEENGIKNSDIITLKINK